MIDMSENREEAIVGDFLLRNPSSELKVWLDKTVCFVSATNDQRYELYLRFSDSINPRFVAEFYRNSRKVKWGDNTKEFSKCFVIGYIDKNKNLPINILFRFELINDQLVCFQQVAGVYADYNLMDAWVYRYCGGKKICDVYDFDNKCLDLLTKNLNQ